MSIGKRTEHFLFFFKKRNVDRKKYGGIKKEFLKENNQEIDTFIMEEINTFRIKILKIVILKGGGDETK